MAARVYRWNQQKFLSKIQRKQKLQAKYEKMSITQIIHTPTPRGWRKNQFEHAIKKSVLRSKRLQSLSHMSIYGNLNRLKKIYGETPEFYNLIKPKFYKLVNEKKRGLGVVKARIAAFNELKSLSKAELDLICSDPRQKTSLM